MGGEAVRSLTYLGDEESGSRLRLCKTRLRHDLFLAT